MLCSHHLYRLTDPETLVVGCQKPYTWLLNNVIIPIRYNYTYTRGVLFYGPPGNGKTLLAKKFVSLLKDVDKRNWNFFSYTSSDFLRKYLGEGEMRLKQIFAEAREKSPSVIFFDEIDSLCPNRNLSKDQSFVSLTSTLLVEMNDLSDVIVIGATNRLDTIDPALRRPGRFDYECFFNLPTKHERYELLSFFLKEQKHNCNVSILSDVTKNYTIADLKHIIDMSKLCLLRDNENVLQMHHVEMNLKKRVDLPKKFIKAIKSKLFPFLHRTTLFAGENSQFITSAFEMCEFESCCVVDSFPIASKECKYFIMFRTAQLYNMYPIEFEAFFEFVSLNSEKYVIAHEQFNFLDVEKFFKTVYHTSTLKIGDDNFQNMASKLFVV